MDDKTRGTAGAGTTEGAVPVSLTKGPWVDLFDPDGRILDGIRGREGAAGTLDGDELGVDMIEMAPGRSFELHSHVGAHVLYILSGKGFIEIDGGTFDLRPGDSVFVAARRAHGVASDSESRSGLRFIAVGIPHRGLESPDRMRLEPREHH